MRLNSVREEFQREAEAEKMALNDGGGGGGGGGGGDGDGKDSTTNHILTNDTGIMDEVRVGGGKNGVKMIEMG